MEAGQTPRRPPPPSPSADSTAYRFGYRVNSKRGTQFRIWATRTLREHLLRGYTLNERRLREKGIGEMEQAVSLLARTLKRHELVTDEGRADREEDVTPFDDWESLIEGV